MHKRNVVFFIHTPKDPTTAVYSNIRRRADALLAAGHVVKIVAPEDFRWLRAVSDRWYPLLYAWAVAFYICRNKDQISTAVFHSHAGWVFHLLRRVHLRIRHVRTVTQFHGLEPLYYQQLRNDTKALTIRFRIMQGLIAPVLIRGSCRQSDQVHCLNSIEREYLVKHRWAVPEKILLYANGVAQDLFCARAYDRPCRRIVFLGQWLSAKGIATLVAAFTEAHSQLADLDLWCIGTRADSPVVLAAFREDVRAAIHVLPRLSREQINQQLFLADIFVFPSRSEGFSMALIEAMASGLPIVATPVGAAPDLLQHDFDALLVPIDDPTSVAAAICRIANDQSLAERLGRHAQQRAREYEWDKVCARYVDIVESLERTRGATQV